MRPGKVTGSDIVNINVALSCSSYTMALIYNYHAPYDHEMNIGDVTICTVISICGALVPICATELYGKFYRNLKREITTDVLNKISG